VSSSDDRWHSTESHRVQLPWCQPAPVSTHPPLFPPRGPTELPALCWYLGGCRLHVPARTYARLLVTTMPPVAISHGQEGRGANLDEQCWTSPHLPKDAHAPRFGADERALPLTSRASLRQLCNACDNRCIISVVSISQREWLPHAGRCHHRSGAFTLGPSVRSLMGPGLLSHERSAKIQLSDASIDAEFLPSLRCQLTRSQLGDNVKRLDASAIPFTDRILAWKDM
jgi:hypothetical protein